MTKSVLRDLSPARGQVLERLELESQLVHERLVGDRLLEHPQAGQIVIKLVLDHRRGWIVDVGQVTERGPELAHPGKLVGCEDRRRLASRLPHLVSDLRAASRSRTSASDASSVTVATRQATWWPNWLQILGDGRAGTLDHVVQDSGGDDRIGIGGDEQQRSDLERVQDAGASSAARR
jgi:hypothetical protein